MLGVKNHVLSLKKSVLFSAGHGWKGHLYYFSSKFIDDFASDYPKWETALPVPDRIKW